MEKYDVCLFNLPQVDEDGKSVPRPPHRTETFGALEEAQKYAADNKDEFDRITVHDASGEKPIIVERYDDGVRSEIEREPEAETAAKETEAEQPAEESST